MMTPPRSCLEYSAVDLAILTGEIGSNQLIPINTAQCDEIMQCSDQIQYVKYKLDINFK